MKQASFFDVPSFQFLDVYRLSFLAKKVLPEEETKNLFLDRLEFEKIITDYPSLLGPYVSRLWQLRVLFCDPN